MEKCILIDPPNMVVGLSEKEALEQSPVHPPIGLAYIAGFLRQNNILVKIIDARSLQISRKEVAEIIKKENPRVVGIAVFTPQFKGALELSKQIKKLCPFVKIAVGGPHIHAEHKEIIKNKSIDFCVRREGEQTMLELIQTLSQQGDLKKVNGITFKQGEEIIVNPDRAFIKNLDSLPFPARDLLPNHVYKGLIPFGKEKMFTFMTTSRGCPFKCKFCSVPEFWPTQRRRSVKNVLDEIEHVYKTYNISCIRFTDEMFVLNKKWLFEFCKGMIDRGLHKIIEWSCDSRVSTVTEEMLRQMKKANCRHIFYGIEFGSQRILDFSGKGTTIAQIKKAVEIAKEVGISIEGNFMIGYPTETKETIMDTINLARSLDCEYTTFCVVTPFPGTKLYEYCKENNLLKSNKWEEYNYFYVTKTGGVIKLKDITPEGLVELFLKTHREFYCRYVIGRVGRDMKDIFKLTEFQEEVSKGLKQMIMQNKQDRNLGAENAK